VTPASRSKPWLGALAAAAGYSLAAPPVGWWPLGFVCLAPLVRSFDGQSWQRRAGLGAVACGGTALAATTPPLALALATFFDAPLWQAALLAVVIGLLFGGSAGAVFGVLSGDPRTLDPFRAALRLGCAWAATEEFRSVFLTGLPWLELGHLLAPAPELAQHAALGGTRLVSFGLVLSDVGVAQLARRETRRAGMVWIGTVALLGLVSLALVPAVGSPEPGAVRKAQGPQPGAVRKAQGPQPEGALRVVLVQPGLPAELRRDTGRTAEILERVVALTRQAGPADVAVWPENVVPAFLPANEALLTPALESLAETVRHVVLGAPRTSADANGAVYNAALLYSDARRVAAHDKVHPVPFAESIPAFSRGWWKRPIAVGAGDAPQTLPIPGAMLGPLICYELLFDELGVAQTRAGADVILNLSHDGYFGGSWGSRQHLLAAPLRAIELGRPLLRATSSGITVAIDSAGRVAARAPAQTPATLRVDVWPGGRATLFARFGSWFAALASAYAVYRTLRDAARFTSGRKARS
jgi:apolipoprotein N-acyltransferase